MSTINRPDRHRFSPDTLTAVRAASRLDNWHGPLELAEHWAWIAWWCWASVTAFGHAPLWLALVVYLISIFFIGGRQRALAGVLHMATHRAFMARHRVGNALGSLLGGHPVFQTFTGYRASHLGEHHGHLGDPARDPDYQQYQRYGLCGDNLNQTSFRRYLRSVVSPSSTGSYIFYLARHRILPSDESPWERWLRLAVFGAVLVWAVLGGWWYWLVLLWFVPLVTTQVWIGAVAELLEHFPIIETAPHVNLRMTWNRDYHLFNRFLLGEKDGEGFHLAHHLFPRTPMWRLREVDAILRQDTAYGSLPRLGGTISGLKQIYRSLPASPLALGAAVPTP
jgi:fatty acid desaturase